MNPVWFTNPTVILGLIGGFILSLVTAFVIGHHQGYSEEHEKFMSFQSDVKAAGDLAKAQHEATIAKHEEITAKVSADAESKLAALQSKADEALKKVQSTQGIKNDYENKIAAIHAAYAGRLLGIKANSSGSGLSGISLTTPTAYDRSSYDLLAANCAITTQMLLSLQEWVASEGAVK